MIDMLDDTELRALVRRRVEIDDAGCWLWVGKVNRGGYGVTSVAGKTRSAHRVSYEWHVGPIPIGLDLDHLCRVRRCVNPDHLEPVTRRENINRGLTRRRSCDGSVTAMPPDEVLVWAYVVGGMSLSKLGERYNCHRQTVAYRLQLHGVQLAPQGAARRAS